MMSRRLLALSGIGVIGVVFHHAIHWVMTGMFWWTDRYVPGASIPDFSALGGASYWTIRVIDQFFVISLPIFLLTTGFFVAGTIGRGDTRHDWRTVFNRIRVLLIPYLLWSAVYVAMRYVFGERFSISEVLAMVVLGTAVIPFYYVPLLIELYILAPFVVALAKKRWSILLLIAALCQLVVVTAAYKPFFPAIPGPEGVYAFIRGTHLLDLGGWFVIGVIIKLHLPAVKVLMARVQPVLMPAILIIALMALAEWNMLRNLSGKEWIATDLTILDKVFALLFVATILFQKNLTIPFSLTLGKLGTKVYGVYLAHMLALDITAKAVYHFLPGSMAYPLFFWVLLGSIGLFGPLLLMKIVKDTPLRRLYVPLFG